MTGARVGAGLRAGLVAGLWVGQAYGVFYLGLGWRYQPLAPGHPTSICNIGVNHTFVIHLSYVCHTFVIHLSYVCHTFVIRLSYVCHMFVIRLSSVPVSLTEKNTSTSLLLVIL